MAKKILLASNNAVKKSGPVPVAPSGEEKIMYPAKCATCEADIEVPFKPDGSRPTFCKECLKDYQRQQARLQELSQSKSKVNSSSPRPVGRPSQEREQPISLRQATSMRPKTFSEARAKKRKSVNLDEVRQLIKESLDTKK